MAVISNLKIVRANAKLGHKYHFSLFFHVGYISPEDRQAAINEVRRYKIEHYYSDKQICDAMNISQPTLRLYKRMMYEENSKRIQEQTKEEIDEHLRTTTARLERIAQKLLDIAEHAELDSDKIKALAELKDLTVGLIKIDAQERDEVLRQYSNKVEAITNNAVAR